jgi:hypothetical protein
MSVFWDVMVFKSVESSQRSGRTAAIFTAEDLAAMQRDVLIVESRERWSYR